jgi:hypothetical protein
VTITLGRDSQRVHFAIADDGAGMDNRHRPTARA